MEIAEAKQKINEQKRNQRGQYWHNIIACVLREVAAEHGKDAANGLIRDCNLKMLGWAEEV